MDDSVFSRSRSKAVELLSRVHDHTTNTYVRGFRMLALGWSDGNSLIPLAFSLLSSAKETNRSKQWLALISTDLSLSDEEVVQMYEKRWDIEVFFKTVKSYLKLTRECYSRSYDALVAQATVVFSRYILLAIEQRMIEQ